jgi:hypothetical protein
MSTDKEKKHLYYLANKEKRHLYYEANKERSKARYQQQRETLLAYQKQYAQENRQNIQNYQHEYYLRRTQKKRGHSDRVPKPKKIVEITKSDDAKAFRIMPVIESKPVVINKDRFLVTFD